MIEGYLAGRFIKLLMRGRTVRQCERAFWSVVIGFVTLIAIATIAQTVFPPEPGQSQRPPAQSLTPR